MKSALEIARERFGGGENVAPLSPKQKAALKEIQDKYDAKVAEAEILAAQQIAAARAAGKVEEARELEEKKARDIASLRAKCEREKEKVRKAAK